MTTFTKIRVSTSEVNTFQLCGFRWLAAHHPGLNLEPRSLGPALTRGLIGHKALENFYTLLKDGIAYATAVDDTLTKMRNSALQDLTVGDGSKSLMKLELSNRLEEYFELYKSDINRWEILGVEQLVVSELEDSHNALFAGRIDLVVRWVYGEYKGEISPVDHKFVYNFWPDKALRVGAQFPNYIWALRQMYPGDTIRRGVVNQIRHRSDAIDKFKRPQFVPSRAKVRTLIGDHAKVATEIATLKSYDLETAKRTVTRNASKFNCEYCPFIELCDADLEGRDTTLMQKTQFKPNSYGYADRSD